MGATNGGAPRLGNLLETGRIMHNATSLKAPPARDPVNDPTPFGSHLFVGSSIVCPAVGTTNTLVAEYIVPAGFRAVITHVLNQYAGSGFVEGDEALLYWTILLNSRSVRGFNQIAWSMGSLADGPYPVPWKIRLKATDILRYVVTVPAGSAIGTGAPNRVICHFVGGEWAEGEE